MSMKVTANNTTVNSASIVNTLIGTNPFTKLDVTNIVSFQTLSILFSTEPPNPDGVLNVFTDTLIYEFAHGYNYIPTIWMMWQNSNPVFPTIPAVGSGNFTYYAFGDDSAAQNVINNATSLSVFAKSSYNDSIDGYINVANQALLYCLADSKNVRLYLRKDVVFVPDSLGVPFNVFVAGQTINMRIYVFTEPGTTSTY